MSFILALPLLAGCGASSVDTNLIPNADQTQISRVEPPCWWVGMNTPLQLLIKGDKISDYDVSIKGGKDVRASAVHKAESLFLQGELYLSEFALCGPKFNFLICRYTLHRRRWRPLRPWSRRRAFPPATSQVLRCGEDSAQYNHKGSYRRSRRSCACCCHGT